MFLQYRDTEHKKGKNSKLISFKLFPSHHHIKKNHHIESPAEWIIPSSSCTTMSFPSEPLPASTK